MIGSHQQLTVRGQFYRNPTPLLRPVDFRGSNWLNLDRKQSFDLNTTRPLHHTNRLRSFEISAKNRTGNNRSSSSKRLQTLGGLSFLVGPAPILSYIISESCCIRFGSEKAMSFPIHFVSCKKVVLWFQEYRVSNVCIQGQNPVKYQDTEKINFRNFWCSTFWR